MDDKPTLLPVWTIIKHYWKHKLWISDFSAPFEERYCRLCNVYFLTGTTKPFILE